MIRIALTKGRIEKSALEILKTCGYDVGELEAKGRKLIFRTGNLEIVLAKAADVITYIDRRRLRRRVCRQRHHQRARREFL